MPRTVAIMQPTYLPWLGYFDLIDQADVFVLFDTAQFSKKSWHQRNRIRTPLGLGWLTVPVKTAGLPSVSIRDAEIALDSGFQRHHLGVVQANYRRAPFFDTYYEAFRGELTASAHQLGDLNIRLIRWLATTFGISTSFELASNLDVQGRRATLMLDICDRVGADICLSAAGAVDYLAREYDPLSRPNVSLVFHNYEHPNYRQTTLPFLPFASAIDLLFNEGDRSLEIIRAGRRPSRPSAVAFGGVGSRPQTGGPASAATGEGHSH
jgi:hypothetical protein